jgi:hypothetical protein
MGFIAKRDSKEFVDYITETNTKDEIDLLTSGLKHWWKHIPKLNEDFPRLANDSANTWYRRFVGSLFYLSEDGKIQHGYINSVLPNGLGKKAAKLKIKDATRKASGCEAFTAEDLEKVYKAYPVKVKFEDYKKNLSNTRTSAQQCINIDENKKDDSEKLHRDAIDMLDIMKRMAADTAAILASMKKQEKYQSDANALLRRIVG